MDNPCIPTARIAELHKADGQVQELHLTGRARSFEDIYKPHRSFIEVMLQKGFTVRRAAGRASAVKLRDRSGD